MRTRSHAAAWRLCFVLLAMLAALALTACGDDDSGASGADDTAATVADDAAAGGGELVAEAKAAVEEAMGEPAFDAAGAPFDMASNEGKTIWFISPSQAVPYTAAVSKGAEEAAKAAGMRLVVFDGKGRVSEWNKGIQQAVSQQADGIILQAIDPRLVSGAIARAESAGIPIVDSDNGDSDEPLTDGVDAHVTVDYTGIGARWAQYIASEADGEPTKVAVFYDPAFHADQNKIDGLSAELERLCPDCELIVERFAVATFAQDLPGRVQNVLRREPDIGWLVAGFGAQVRYIIQGMRQGGADDVRLVAVSAEPENLELIEDGEMLEADIGVPTDWLGWAQVDELGRLMAGADPAGQRIPVRLFTAENLAQAGDQLYGAIDFRSEFRSGWTAE